MALPTAYLTSTKNLPAILAAIQQAKAPERFTQRFLESLEFKSNSDRLIIGLLKSLRFTDDQGKPTARYFEYLDQSQSGRIMAEATREAYSDLFQVNTSAQTLSKQEIINKFKTLSQGTIGEAVLDKMAMTFTALVKLADFNAPAAPARGIDPEANTQNVDGASETDSLPPLTGANRGSRSFGGLHYNIQIILPESRDPKVYDALFRSLHEHLL
jgi:Family of unknown function (DUF5343)